MNAIEQFLTSEVGIESLAPEEVPSGLDFSAWKIWKYLKQDSSIVGPLLDFGCGAGEKVRELGELGVSTWGLEINSLAVRKIRDEGGIVYKTDVRRFASGDFKYGGFASSMEMMQGVLWQALGPSLLDKDFEKALGTMDIFMRPGGYLFMVDFLRPDLLYPELIEKKGEQECLRNCERWRRRIKANYEAFQGIEVGGNNFPYGAYAVGKPGVLKKTYDWSDPPTLRRFYDSRNVKGWRGNVFERFAQNLDFLSFARFLENKLLYRSVEREIVAWPSRNEGEWYPGILAVYQKPKTFRYSPWKKGLSVDDPNLFDLMKGRKGSPYRVGYWAEWFESLLKNLDSWENHQSIIEELAQKAFAWERVE